MHESVLGKIHGEIAETQKRRFQLYILKIGFVTALLGFGGIHIQEVSSFYQALYLVPLVAVFFDLLIMGEHISIRRMGTYLRLYSEEDEKTYEGYVMRHRDKFITVGLAGFTTLSFVAAFFLLRVTKVKMNDRVSLVDIVWFTSLFISFVISVFYAHRRIVSFDKEKKKE